MTVTPISDEEIEPSHVTWRTARTLINAGLLRREFNEQVCACVDTLLEAGASTEMSTPGVRQVLWSGWIPFGGVEIPVNLLFRDTAEVEIRRFLGYSRVFVVDRDEEDEIGGGSSEDTAALLANTDPRCAGLPISEIPF